MLSKGRIVLPGQSPYSWEQEGLDFIRKTLPDSDPFNVWELVELPNPQSGQVHEIDCLVLGYKALYLVEMKGGPGRYEGDTTDWFRTPPGGVAKYMEPPYRLTSRKARIIKGMLERANRGNRDVRIPWVQPLVFLTAEELELRFRSHGDFCVVTRDTFLKAVQFHQFPGCEDSPNLPRVSTPQARAIKAAFERLGVRPSAGALQVTSYNLKELIAEGPGYEDRLAEHTSMSSMRKRARIYLVPQQTSPEHRQRLRRAAEREVHLLDEVKEHPNVLRMVEYVPDAPLGPTVLFDHFDGIPLDAFMRTRPELSFEKRVELIEKIGNTLAHCHRKKVLHGALSPSAVLVHADDGTLDVRLFNFQLGEGQGVSATVHWSALGTGPWAAYQAPELRANPMARSEISDVFSLGAVAYFILTGHEPAQDGEELDRILDKDGALDPRVVDDAIHPQIAEAVRFATALGLISRADSVDDWLNNIFLESVTLPDLEPEPEIDPLTARKEDIIGETLMVERVLGQGSSARVLQVTSQEHDDRTLALKVALSDAHSEHLEEEGQLLDRLHHARIVQFFEQREIAGRTCLLIALAGEESLRQRLRKEGPLSLDFAARFGEELLLALEELEDERVLHRDIKPENLGVGTVSRKAQHLVLFDFSLAVDVRDPSKCADKLKQLGAGTTGYRDPFLRQRGAWDHAADRWAAAITLHEMLTGAAPGWLPEGVAPWADEAKLNLAAERFDPSVRDQLTKFFERALRAEAEQRFESARAMRQAWNLAFESPVVAATPAASDHPSDHETPPGETDDDALPWQGMDLSQIAADASIQLLPLGNRAKNALDRAGLSKVIDLLDLPDNRLSAVRGVGTLVAREILLFRDAWQQASAAERSKVALFEPDYRGDDLRLTQTELAAESVRVFEDAGLATLRLLAAAPTTQVEALATRAGTTSKRLRQLLDDSGRAKAAAAHPSSLDEWLAALLPKQGARRTNLETMFGLAGELQGNLEITQAEAARALGQTPANLSIQISAAAKTWAEHPHFAELSTLVHELVGSDAPARPGAEAARTLALRLGEPATDALTTCKSAALIRMVCSVERAAPSAPRWVRIHERAWLVADESLTTPVRELGQAADKLAARSIIASAGETARTLRAAVEGTRLERSSDEALAQLATAAAKDAACSSRLEIYPRGLEAKRALDLSSSVLGGELSSERIRKLVAQRYPDAEPLPDRPELDGLVEKHGLAWDGAHEVYRRKGAPPTQMSVGATTLPEKYTTTHSGRAINPHRVAVHEFEEQIALCIERRSVRVLGASVTHARTIALALREQFGLNIVDLDALFWSKLRVVIQAEDISQDDLLQADADGPTGEMWSELTEIIHDVGQAIADEVLPFQEPTLIVQPGILARFGLGDFLLQLFDKATSAHSAATLLLIPGSGADGAARINRTLTIPHVGLPNTLQVPLQWITQRTAA